MGPVSTGAGWPGVSISLISSSAYPRGRRLAERDVKVTLFGRALFLLAAGAAVSDPRAITLGDHLGDPAFETVFPILHIRLGGCLFPIGSHLLDALVEIPQTRACGVAHEGGSKQRPAAVSFSRIEISSAL